MSKGGRKQINSLTTMLLKFDLGFTLRTSAFMRTKICDVFMRNN